MVRFVEVTKVFPNGYIGLEDVSFEVEPGELVYITGESGAGKTTLMRLLIREIRPTQGDIYLGEQRLADLSGRNIPYHRRRVGVIFQDYQLIPDRTIFENAALILEVSGVPNAQIKQRVTDVLELVGLPDKGQLFPVQLSGGELQRAAIARALVTAPEVLFADEPTGNLDPETSIGIMGLLKKIQEFGTTVLVATHDPGIMAQYPSRYLHLKQGKIVEDSAAPAQTVSSQDDQSASEPDQTEKAKKKKDKK
jgi:cell division transport system ATP-binding protein